MTAMNKAMPIPARWASTRFPGKPLHLIAGKLFCVCMGEVQKSRKSRLGNRCHRRYAHRRGGF